MKRPNNSNNNTNNYNTHSSRRVPFGRAKYNGLFSFTFDKVKYVWSDRSERYETRGHSVDLDVTFQPSRPSRGKREGYNNNNPQRGPSSSYRRRDF